MLCLPRRAPDANLTHLIQLIKVFSHIWIWEWGALDQINLCRREIPPGTGPRRYPTHRDPEEMTLNSSYHPAFPLRADSEAFPSERRCVCKPNGANGNRPSVNRTESWSCITRMLICWGVNFLDVLTSRVKCVNHRSHAHWMYTGAVLARTQD